ncbi:MAG: NADH:ubiquinone oxidoreductase subunit J [Coxiella sp. (in: Bacteria)]|nr:MAG: NADH:ubiquinone oxidoreductase subunit J [Coxiella sp. (in: g-proteobacteria)]
MNGFPIYEIVFYVFAVLLIASALCVVLTRNTVHSVLALIFAFFCSAGLWLLLQTEFLALMLIFVYVGAVMTLMLFVVMMLNIDLEKIREKFTRFLPIAIAVLVVLATILSLAFSTKWLNAQTHMPVHYPENYSNTKALGTLLFTRYLYPFEIAGMILLVAMISAISLAFFGRKPGTKSQRMSQQHLVTKKDRLKIIKMKSEDK